MRRYRGRSLGLILAALLIGACEPDAAPDRLMEDRVSGETIDRADDPRVARVDDTDIHYSDVQRAAARQGLVALDTPLVQSDPVFQATLDEMIDQRLLALDAVRAGTADTPEAQRRLFEARERILGNLRVETYLSQRVTDAAIRDLYEAQSQLGNRGEERRARQIVVADAEAAESVRERLDSGEDFESLVDELSEDESTRDVGGDLGWLSRDMVAAPLRASIFQTEIGGRVGPVEGPSGWYVLEVRDARTPGQRSFEEVRDEIARFMTFEAIQDLITELRSSAEIERFDLASAEDDSDDESPAEDANP